ncbi:hypothetical protein PR048_001868 [Dryococelus australis]|uniref:Uncharacterized protein n=1 Tax=Dryococelus australis TaxID=614101 RepID=A0ABQ9III4_9NEOP|nr:hypothetical protein PR048_001868 [Dryococelus australis]
MHASSVSAETSNVFGVVQRLYTFFAFSTQRWEGTSQTRWYAKSEAVQSLTKNIHGVVEALNELTEEVDRVNKEVQNDDIILSRSIEILKGLTDTIERLRNTPSEWLETAKVISESIGVEPTMEPHRVTKKKTMPIRNMAEHLQKLHALDLLKLIHSRNLVEAFPNVCVALRIYITLPK